jgi:hypothetical protein
VLGRMSGERPGTIPAEPGRAVAGSRPATSDRVVV